MLVAIIVFRLSFMGRGALSWSKDARRAHAHEQQSLSAAMHRKIQCLFIDNNLGVIVFMFIDAITTTVHRCM